MEPREYTGVYYCGTYKYYDIIDYDTCFLCRHFSDNEMELRFECWCKHCEKRDKKEE